MEFIIELILELLFEGGKEICTNKKISKWIRYPISFIMISFFLIVIFGIIVLGIFLMKDTVFGGLVFLVIGIIMLIAFIYKFRKVYRENYKNNIED